MLEIAKVTAIDTAGLGALVSAQDWASAYAVPLKLMNLTPKIEKLLEHTHLRLGFEICSVAEVLDLLCRAFRQSQSPLSGVERFLDDGEPVLVQIASSR